MIWHLDGPGGESQAEVTGRFHANSAQVQLNAARAVKAFMDFNVAQIRQRVRSDARSPVQTKVRPKTRRKAQ